MRVRRAMPIVVGPTPDYRVQAVYDLARGGLPMLPQVVVDGAEMPHHLLLLRSRQDHASIASHGEAEELKPSSMWTMRVFASLSCNPRSARKALSLGAT